MFSEVSKETLQQRKSLFQQFVHAELPGVDYSKLVESMVRTGGRRLIVSLDDFRKFSPDQCQGLLDLPHEFLPAFQEGLKTLALLVPLSPDYPEVTKDDDFFVGVEGSFGPNNVSPRDLTSHLLRKLVAVEGIVTKASNVKPKLLKSIHYCERTGKGTFRSYRDETSLLGIPTGAIYPTKDEQGNPLTFEMGLSAFSDCPRDTQVLYVQEMPERAPAGQLPRSVRVYVEADLVDRVKPGDRVRVMGIYRALPAEIDGNQTKGIFYTALVANNIQLLSKEVFGPVLSGEDIEDITRVSQDPEVFEKLSRSLAPSIFGHEQIKKAILLQLLGGEEKNLKNGTHLRGDVNILLIGDPSTAKSQMLRFVLNIAPLAISTSGRGSSGVGLTAAVTSDSETRERRLEAGAMVLADRGIVCIDEFDKMSVDDRVAIHEVMEQQTVTISKAGIHASLNARCSILAAANPIFGKYDRNKKPTENIALPDSLLSRFDLLFIVLDNLDEVNDRKIATHVLTMHRYRSSKEETTHESKKEERSIYATFDTNQRQHTGEKLFSVQFIKKYLLYAKSISHPVLSAEAAEVIANNFCELRRGSGQIRTLPVTPRLLESMIRLGVAHAKCRLSNEVASTIMDFSLFHNTNTSTLPVQPNTTNTADIDMEGDASSANNRKRKRTPDDSGEDQRGQTKKSKGGKTGEDTGKGKKLTFAQRKVLFEKTLSAYMNQNQAFEIVPRADFHTSLQEATAAISAQPFEKEEVESILTAMADEGKNVFYDEENIMFV